MKLNLFVISDDFAKGDDDLFLRYLAYTWRHSPLAFEYSGVNRSDWSVVEIQRRIAENDCFVVAVVDSSLGEKTSTAVDAAKQHKRGYIVAAPLVLALDRRRRRHAGLSEGSCVVTFDDAMAAIVEWVSKRWTTAATT